jgi:hypothetical protein
MQLTVFHDGQFWVAVIEVSNGENLKVYKRVFGAEPSDSEIFDFMNNEAFKLISDPAQLSLPESTPAKVLARDFIHQSTKNPKRSAREAAKALKERGVSTYAQETLKAQIESSKLEHKIIGRLKKDELNERKYMMSREKAKKRHRGR